MRNVTLEMLEMLPSWMKMRADPSNSEGAKFLDVIGGQLKDIQDLTANILSAHHLQLDTFSDGIDLLSIDRIYRVHIQTATVDGDTEIYGIINGVNVPLAIADTLYDFYKYEERYYLDTSNLNLYTKDKFDTIVINGAVFPDVEEHSIWGPYDEIGLLLGCKRIPGELNDSYKSRLLDVFQNIGNSTRKGLINFLSRSFCINKDEVIINELDREFVASLTNRDGTITRELKEYVNISNKINLIDTNTYWEILEENKAGLSYLPIVWDVPLTSWDDKFIQSGVGDTNDLEVIGPDQDPSIQDFTYHVGVTGLRVTKNLVYPEHKFKYRLYAKGHIYDDSFSPEQYKYSVIASELIPLKFNVTAAKQYSTDSDINFSGAAGDYVSYTTVTEQDKKKAKYILKNTVVQDGSIVMNPNNRYIEILANLKTSDPAVTPTINSVTINYKNSAQASKTIVIDRETGQEQNGSTIHSGFDTNTWQDPSPLLRVRNDTNDNYNILTFNTSMTLAHGEYEKLYSSEGDWDDGGSINLRVSQKGTLKLSI